MKLPQNKHEVRKPTKTLAGVTPIAVMCYPKKCLHGTCLYCPSLNVPQSYTPKSPPVLRAERLKYDAFKQVESRLKAYKLMNHPTDKIELIVMGGNFLEYPKKYKIKFIKSCFDALNNKKSSSLEQAKKLNEKAKHRCVALCIESRPDTIVNAKNKYKNIIKELLNYGCTRVELGVQCLDDEICMKINRHQTLKQVESATELLKNAGYKVGFHLMLGLPFSNQKKDLAMFVKLFEDEKFKPDQLKIYPCQVIKGAKLENLYKKGKYKPYSEKQIKELIIQIFKIIPNYCRVMRIMREIHPDFLIAGTHRIDLRKDIEQEITKRKLKNKIKEIRIREIGFAIRDKIKNQKINKNLKLKVTKYKASGEKEYFLEFVNKNNILFGLCRLRIISGKEKDKSKAFIRELHVYGKSLKIGEKAPNFISQHRGLGKKLMKQAEKLAKQNKSEQLLVISGIGVREYYKKLGYNLDKNKNYMVKTL
jgi:elongator complex protein 3